MFVITMRLNLKTLLHSLLALLCLASCSKHGDFLYETTGMLLSNSDNSGKAAVDSVDSVSSKAYAIRLKTHNVVTGYKGPNKDENESGYVRRFRTTDLKIYVLQNFDANHLAGSDVSACFLYHYGPQYTIDYLVQERIMSYPRGRPNPDTEFDESYYLMLMHPPDSSGAYTFRVELTFSDGRKFTDTTHVTLINEL